MGIVADQVKAIAGKFDNQGYFYGQIGAGASVPIDKWSSDLTHNLFNTSANNSVIRGIAIDHNAGEIHVGINGNKYRITDGALISATYNFGRDAAVDPSGGLIYTQNNDQNLYRNGSTYVSAATFDTHVASGAVRGVHISENDLWVGTNNARLHKIDISDVVNPILVASYDVATAGNFSSFVGDFEDITDGDKNLIYIANRGSLQIIAFNTETGVANEMMSPGFQPIVLTMGPNGEMVVSQYTNSFYPIDNILDSRSDMETPPTATFGGGLSNTTYLNSDVTDQILARFSVSPTNADAALYDFKPTMAQFDPHTAQYLANQSMINPAYAGVHPQW